jgi:hypothetical protein
VNASGASAPGAKPTAISGLPSRHFRPSFAPFPAFFRAIFVVKWARKVLATSKQMKRFKLLNLERMNQDRM